MDRPAVITSRQAHLRPVQGAEPSRPTGRPALMALLTGYYTDNRAVLFELERALTILEIEYHGNGQPLPALLEQARQQMRDLTGGESPARHTTKAGETPKVSQKAQSVTIDVMTASKILGRTPQQVRTYCRSGNLAAVKRGSTWLIFKASVEQRRKT